MYYALCLHHLNQVLGFIYAKKISSLVTAVAGSDVSCTVRETLFG